MQPPSSRRGNPAQPPARADGGCAGLFNAAQDGADTVVGDRTVERDYVPAGDVLSSLPNATVATRNPIDVLEASIANMTDSRAIATSGSMTQSHRGDVAASSGFELVEIGINFPSSVGPSTQNPKMEITLPEGKVSFDGHCVFFQKTGESIEQILVKREDETWSYFLSRTGFAMLDLSEGAGAPPDDTYVGVAKLTETKQPQAQQMATVIVGAMHTAGGVAAATGVTTAAAAVATFGAPIVAAATIVGATQLFTTLGVPAAAAAVLARALGYAMQVGFVPYVAGATAAGAGGEVAGAAGSGATTSAAAILTFLCGASAPAAAAVAFGGAAQMVATRAPVGAVAALEAHAPGEALLGAARLAGVVGRVPVRVGQDAALALVEAVANAASKTDHADLAAALSQAAAVKRDEVAQIRATADAQQAQRAREIAAQVAAERPPRRSFFARFLPRSTVGKIFFFGILTVGVICVAAFALQFIPAVMAVPLIATMLTPAVFTTLFGVGGSLLLGTVYLSIRNYISDWSQHRFGRVGGTGVNLALDAATWRFLPNSLRPFVILRWFTGWRN